MSPEELQQLRQWVEGQEKVQLLGPPAQQLFLVKKLLEAYEST